MKREEPIGCMQRIIRSLLEQSSKRELSLKKSLLFDFCYGEFAGEYWSLGQTSVSLEWARNLFVTYKFHLFGLAILRPGYLFSSLMDRSAMADIKGSLLSSHSFLSNSQHFYCPTGALLLKWEHRKVFFHTAGSLKACSRTWDSY